MFTEAIRIDRRKLASLNGIKYNFNGSAWYWHPEVKSIDDYSFNSNQSKDKHFCSLERNRLRPYHNDENSEDEN